MEELITRKIKKVNELSKIVAQLKERGKKIVQCHGVFDLVHPGHLYHFEAAKKQGDILIVSTTADRFVKKGPGRPVFSENLRAKNLANYHIVDYVVISEDVSAVKLLKKIKPNVYFKGQEYELALKDPKRNIYKEAKAIESVKGEIRFSYEPSFSSSKIFKDFFDIYPKETKDFLDKFGSKYSSQEILGFLEDIQDLKILIVGETIIDEYNYVKTMGKVAKADLIASKYLEKEIFAGGVLAVANHLAGFCKNVDLLTVLGGKNSYEKFVKKKLNRDVKVKIFFDKEGQTIVKSRFINPTFFNKIFEIYYFDDRDISAIVSQEIQDYLVKILKNYDLVIVNDYGHGFFNEKMIDILTKKAKVLAVNTQTNSANFGFNLITKYKKATYICIDEPEARLATQNRDGDILKVMEKLLKTIDVQKLVITQGHLGSVGKEKGGKLVKIPVLSYEVVDRVGAGDAYLAISSALVAKNTPIEVTAFVGNVVGALQVATVGNKSPVDPDSVSKFIQTLLK